MNKFTNIIKNKNTNKFFSRLYKSFTDIPDSKGSNLINKKVTETKKDSENIDD